MREISSEWFRPVGGIGSRERWLTIAGVSLVALVFRYVLVTRMAFPLAGDFIWTDATGWNLALGHGFTVRPTGYLPAIYRTPGYPAFLAVIYKIFGHSIHAALVGNAVLDSMTAVMVTLTGWRLLGRTGGSLGGLLYALYPYSALFCAELIQDTMLTLAVMMTLYLTLRAQSEPGRVSRWVLVGVMIGATAWVKPFMALYGMIPALVVFAGTRTPVAKKWIAVAAMVVVSMLVVSPWVVRNYQEFHSFPPMAVGGTGENMYYMLVEVEGREDEFFHALSSDPALQASSDREYVAATVNDGQSLIDEENGYARLYGPQLMHRWPGVLRVSALHIPRLWVTFHTLGYGGLVSLAAPVISVSVLLLGGIGMYVERRRWRSLLALYASVGIVTLIYAPYSIEARYTLPVRPVMVLFVTVALIFLYREASKLGPRRPREIEIK